MMVGKFECENERDLFLELFIIGAGKSFNRKQGNHCEVKISDSFIIFPS